MPFDAVSASCALGSKPNCQICPASGHCMLGALPRQEAILWNQALMPHVPLSTVGKMLYETGGNADSIYTVRAGCLKAFTVDKEGNERVRGFYFPGDIVGLDALASGRYPATVVAVIPSQVCRVARGHVMELMQKAPTIARRLVERTSGELSRALALSGDYTADERVAAFILAMQERLPLGASLRLPMTRRDIANYLRLATETVCRALSRFELKGWIDASDREITLRNPGALHVLADPVGLTAARPAMLAA